MLPFARDNIASIDRLKQSAEHKNMFDRIVKYLESVENWVGIKDRSATIANWHNINLTTIRNCRELVDILSPSKCHMKLYSLASSLITAIFLVD